MYCNACGKAIAEDVRFCSYCGNVVGIPTAPGRLLRARADRRSQAFCAGLAQHFDLDVTIVRVLTIFLTLATGGLPGRHHLLDRMDHCPIRAGNEVSVGNATASRGLANSWDCHLEGNLSRNVRRPSLYSNGSLPQRSCQAWSCYNLRNPIKVQTHNPPSGVSKLRQMLIFRAARFC